METETIPGATDRARPASAAESTGRRRVLAVVNGAAGGGRCGARADVLLRALAERGVDVDVRRTERAGHATELVEEALRDEAVEVLAVGGDGTTFEVVNGLFRARAEARPPRAPSAETPAPRLGILPLGTGNSFLRDFGVRTPEDAIDALVRGRTRRADVIEVEHDEGRLFYVNLLSVGFSARAGALVNRSLKPLGALGYVLAVLANVAKLEHPVDAIRLDDGAGVDARPAALLSFSNSRFTGGAMMMAPGAEVDDGLLDVVRVGELGRARFVATFPRIFRGSHVGAPGIEAARAARVEFVSPRRQDVMIDGEIVQLTLRTLRVHPRALEVIA